MKYIITAAAVGLALWWYKKNQPSTEDEPISEDSDQLPTTFETIKANAIDLMDTITNNTPKPVDTMVDTVNANRKAFLDMIAYSEGTASAGDDGYRMMFGGRLCDNLDDHPRQLFPFTDGKGRKLFSSAAGRYQFLSKTWDSLAAKLGLSDFGEAAQDEACLELIRERGALADVDAGNIAAAIKKCAPTWASLPGAGYAQPERKLGSLLTAYQNSGGELSTA